jgi:hypothetical protein
MKRYWMLGAATAILFSLGCDNQKPELGDDFSGLQGLDQKSDQFSSKMKLLGSLDYGQTSATVKYHNPPKYLAYKFGGQKGDQVVIDVASPNGDAYAWLTNNDFKILAKNDDSGDSLDSHIEFTLPGNKNPDIITYYIIFKTYDGADASFHVSLANKACVDKVFCIQGSHWDATQCKCVTDQQTCGGIAGIQCPAGQKCVDNPNDSCDPNNGGADCSGMCVRCFDNVLCAMGYHWDTNACSCVKDVCVDTIACLVGSHWSSVQCKCVSDTCVDNVLCAISSHWSQADCTCVAN